MFLTSVCLRVRGFTQKMKFTSNISAFLDQVAQHLEPTDNIGQVFDSAITELTNGKNNLKEELERMPISTLVHYQLTFQSTNVVKLTPKLTEDEKLILDKASKSSRFKSLIKRTKKEDFDDLRQCLMNPGTQKTVLEMYVVNQP